jgi:hypothetical protein
MFQSRKWGMGYFILFKTTGDATRFVDLRRKGMQSYPREVQDKINSIINVCRRANFVAIYASEEQSLRADIARQQWLFEESQMRQ